MKTINEQAIDRAVKKAMQKLIASAVECKGTMQVSIDYTSQGLIRTWIWAHKNLVDNFPIFVPTLASGIPAFKAEVEALLVTIKTSRKFYEGEK